MVRRMDTQTKATMAQAATGATDRENEWAQACGIQAQVVRSPLWRIDLPVPLPGTCHRKTHHHKHSQVFVLLLVSNA